MWHAGVANKPMASCTISGGHRFRGVVGRSALVRCWPARQCGPATGSVSLVVATALVLTLGDAEPLIALLERGWRASTSRCAGPTLSCLLRGVGASRLRQRWRSL